MPSCSIRSLPRSVMLICAHRMMRRRPIGNSSVVPIQPVLRRLTWPLDEAQESTSPMHKSQKEDTTMGLVPRRSSMLHTSLGFVDSKSAGFRITQTGSGAQQTHSAYIQGLIILGVQEQFKEIWPYAIKLSIWFRAEPFLLPLLPLLVQSSLVFWGDFR